MVVTGERVTRAQSRVGLGILLTLVIAVPTLVAAEDWHGRPLIDQGGYGWLVPAFVTALAFAAGGAVAGRHAGRAPRALGHGLVVGAVAVLALLAADVVRRLIMNPTLPMGVVYYWLDGAAVALFLSLAGAASGHRLFQAGRLGRRRSPGTGPSGMR